MLVFDSAAGLNHWLASLTQLVVSTEDDSRPLFLLLCCCPGAGVAWTEDEVLCQREFTLRLKSAGGQRGGHASQNIGIGEGCKRGSLHDSTGCLSASGVASMNRPLLTRQIRLCGISCCFYLKLFKLEVFSVSRHQHDIIPSRQILCYVTLLFLLNYAIVSLGHYRSDIYITAPVCPRSELAVLLVCLSSSRFRNL